MNVTISIPEEVAAVLPDPKAAALLGVALEGYRLGKLSVGQVARLLGLGVWEAGEILAAHGCHLWQSPEEVEDDVRTLHDVLKP